jgi:hypothetical protein
VDVYFPENASTNQDYDNYYTIDSYIDILAECDSISGIESTLVHIMERDSGSLRAHAARVLMREGIPLRREVLEDILRDTFSASYFVFQLAEDSLLHLIPSDLYIEGDIAYFDFNNLLFEYDIYPDDILFLGEREITYKGSERRIYVYQMEFFEEGEKYIGISGPYPLQSGSEMYINILTDFSDTPFVDDNVDSIVEEILDNYDLEE